MITFHAEEQRLHAAHSEFNRGRLDVPYERPERADIILSAMQHAALGAVQIAGEFTLEHAARVHDAGYLAFLQSAWQRWADAGRHGDALPTAWAVRCLRSDRIPQSIDGLLSWYSFDTATAITPGTWTAVRRSMDVALAGAQQLAGGARSAFSLCRPPGHHAATDCYGGYCFLNNAAIAAQFLLDKGLRRVAILDVDYHHGNGTQEIFYRRDDVLYASIHADPATDYPYFLGYADERGEGLGEGCNLNLPLPRGTGWAAWSAALTTALAAINDFGAEALVVSLGVDTFEHDPISGFCLASTDFPGIGAAIAGLQLPTLWVMEGGYAVEALGANVAATLAGFQSAV